MIFVTTGTQAPFNRLVKAMDDIADELGGEEIIVQAAGVDFKTRNLSIVTFLHPAAYNEIFTAARLIVSHAGMGSIVSALTYGKPIIVIPRVASLGEHRNDHQIDGARKMEMLGYVPVAYNERELKEKVLAFVQQKDKSTAASIGRHASGSLTDSIRGFILNT